MKKIVFSALCIVVASHLNAQDLIVTSQNDSINAKIMKFKKGVIYFRSMKNGELKKTSLALDKVETYEKSFYKTPEIPAKAKLKPQNEEKRFRIETNAGFAYRTAKLVAPENEILEKYAKSLKSGLNLGLGAHYFIQEPWALGLKFNSFYSTKTENDLLASFSDGGIEEGLKNDVSINFIGPSLLTRLLSRNKKNALLLSTSVGYMTYKNEETIGSRSFTSKGNAIGVSVDVGYDIGLTDFMSIGFVVSWTTGSLREVEVEENGTITAVDLIETQGDREGLSRINISGGLRFYL